MEKIKQELKSMQSNPNLYLANYFSDLKRDVDLTFFGQDGDEKAKYLEIINKIEDIEQEYYRRSKPFNTFDHEIESIKIEKIEQNSFRKKLKRDDQEIESPVELNKQSINDLKYKIEQKLFQNKTILFVKNYFNKQEKFLLILTNAYLRKNTFDNIFKKKYFNRETFIAYFILVQKFNKNIEELDALNGLKTLKKIKFNTLSRLHVNLFSDNQITKIHSSTFNDLNLELMLFPDNKIKKLDPTTFNGLTNLEVICFQDHKIKELDPTTFNGLTSLKEIYFSDNQITNIDPSTFNGLTNLEVIWFGENKIKELDPTILNGLTSLKKIDFSYNQITTIHPSTFNGLTNLKVIWLQKNKFKEEELDPTTFNGLTSLKEIIFHHTCAF